MKHIAYRIKGFIRFLLFWLLAPLVRYERYHNPGGVAGWQGYHTLPKPRLALAFLDIKGTRHFFWSLLLVLLLGTLILTPGYIVLAQDDVTPPAVEVTAEPTPEPITIDPDLISRLFDSGRDTAIIIALIIGGGLTIVGGLGMFLMQRSVRNLAEKLYSGASEVTQEKINEGWQAFRDLALRVIDFGDDVLDGVPGGKVDTVQVSRARDKPDSFG